ncbi:MAG: hypothetical protein LBD99_00995, partial [Candidatus Margulisbacteria bacterium]|nr:hypothetical protein [Candidatus Margulisiibacteriota bacterium]
FFRLIKSNVTPTVTVLQPDIGRWLDNRFAFSGTANSQLELDKILVSFTASDGTVLTSNVLAAGTLNWTATFDISNAELLYATAHNPATLTVTAVTKTSPPLQAAYEFLYRIDGLAPVTINAPVGVVPAVGTLNVSGVFADAHSGLQAIGVSINGIFREIVSFNAPASGSVSFNFPVPVNADFVTVDIVASDNAYPSPNILWHSFAVSRDYSLLPTGSITSPVTPQIYVNNTMNIAGTAKVASGNIAGVWVRFTSAVSPDAQWITANYAPASANVVTWTAVWRVPGSDPHGATYNAELRILSSGGVLAEVSPNALAEYEKDAVGPAVTFINMFNNMLINQIPGSPNFSAEAMTYTEGARVSAAVYLIVDGARYLMTDVNFSNSAPNHNWYCSVVDWLGLSGSAHSIQLEASDIVANKTTSNILIIRAVPSVVVTDPLPPGGSIDATTVNSFIYATSLNTVEFKFNTLPAGTSFAAYVGFAGTAGQHPTSFNVVGDVVSVSLNSYRVTPSEEVVHLLNLVETNGSAVTIHCQPVVYDITPPTANVIFDGVTRYYQGGVIAPNEYFAVNVLDRASANFAARGSGFNNQNIRYGYVTDNAAEWAAGTIHQSVFDSGATTNNNIASLSFDPLGELLRFKVSLKQGVYDLSIDAIDNAGNHMTATFNVYGLIVNRDVTGESGTLDKTKFITAYPNPYNPNKDDVLFTYYLKDNAQKARIMVYNQIGELVHPIVIEGPGQEGTRAGYNQVPWDGLDKFNHIISSGVYIYLIVIDGDRGQTFHKSTMAVIKE